MIKHHAEYDCDYDHRISTDPARDKWLFGTATNQHITIALWNDKIGEIENRYLLTFCSVDCALAYAGDFLRDHLNQPPIQDQQT